MKRWLYGTSALAALGLACPAGAAGEPLRLGIGGHFRAYAIVARQDDAPGRPGAGLRDHKIAREAELRFRGHTRLDNGLKVGLDIQLEAETCADQIDESFLFVEGAFGRLMLGSADPATDLMWYGAPTPIIAHGLNGPGIQHPAFGANAVGIPNTKVGISGDNEKLTYFTPRIAGLQLGLSYTPDTCEESNPLGPARSCGGSYGGLQANANAGQQSEVVEIGFNHIARVGWFDLNLHGALAAGRAEAPTPGLEDQDQWGLGAEIGFAGWSIGASYFHDDQGTSGADTDRREWNVGARYSLGPLSLGAVYANSRVEAGAGGGEDTLDALEIGGRYRLGPGVSLSGGVQVYDYRDNAGAPGAENRAVLVLFGTSVLY